MSNRLFRPTSPALLAAALVVVPAAYAESPTVTPAVQKAFTQLEQGPDQLRRFVQRTRMIYALNYAEVVSAYEAKRATEPPARVAASAVTTAEPERR